MHRLFNKKEILTIPNMLSAFRLLLIPVIIWLYCFAKNYYAALAVIILSGITDIADGKIARKFNMISDFGKILDPVADKATQGSLILCLTVRYKLMIPLIIVFLIREIAMICMGYLSIKRKDSVNSARWYGKVNTVIIYSVTFLLILFPEIPPVVADVMIYICAAVMIASLVLYSAFYRKILKK